MDPTQPSRRLHLDPEVLRDMYVNRGMSIAAIAIANGVGRKTVRKHLAEAGVEIRPATAPAGLDPAVLRDMYVTQGMTAPEIAAALGISRSTVRVYLVRAGVEFRPRWPKLSGLDPEVLRDMYVTRGMSLAEVAAALGVSPMTVRVHLVRAGVEIRPAPARAGLDPEVLRDMYVTRGMTAKEIAAALGIGRSTVLTHLAQAGVELRTPGPKLPGLDPEALRDMYVTRGMSLAEVAAALGVSPISARAYLARAGVEIRPRGPRPARDMPGYPREEQAT